MPPPNSRRTPNGGAHWPRPTGILPASYPMSKACHCEPARGLVWQSVFPLCRTITTRGNGFPRRCAPRNDIFMKMRCSWTGGAKPPPLRMFCKFLCRAAPMCAAARQSPYPQRRSTLAPPYRYFTGFVPHVKTLSLRTSPRAGVAIRTPPAPHPHRFHLPIFARSPQKYSHFSP